MDGGDCLMDKEPSQGLGVRGRGNGGRGGVEQ